MPFHWRPVWRAFTSALWIAFWIGIVALAMWLRWGPEDLVDHEGVVEHVPIVGPVIGRLQEAFAEAVAPETPEASVPAVDDPEPIVIYRTADGETMRVPFDFLYEPREPRPYFWVSAGTALRREPELDAELVVEFEAMTNLFVDERRGDWVRVRHRGVEGWVLEPTRGSTGFLGTRPEPVLPLPAARPAAADIDRAVAVMSAPPERVDLAGYSLLSDADTSALVDRCAVPLENLDDLFRDRMGLEPVGEAAEALLIFDWKASYEAFAHPTFPAQGGHAGRGYAATWVQGRSVGEVCGTLIHEAAHLTSRRTIGPALPPWLGEGIAEYAEWTLVAEPSSRPRSGNSPVGRFPGLESLVSLDVEAFRADSGAERYAAAGYWVTYLLDGSELADGFRSFLSYLALGGPWAEGASGTGDLDAVPEAVRETPDLGDDLVHHLGQDVRLIDAGFRAWLWSRG